MAIWSNAFHDYEEWRTHRFDNPWQHPLRWSWNLRMHSSWMSSCIKDPWPIDTSSNRSQWFQRHWWCWSTLTKSTSRWRKWSWDINWGSQLFPICQEAQGEEEEKSNEPAETFSNPRRRRRRTTWGRRVRTRNSDWRASWRRDWLWRWWSWCSWRCRWRWWRWHRDRCCWRWI